jgi:glycosyltransferase involved in cell wall biosynthesis
MRKKRILFSTEFSGLNTGYACIASNLLKAFHDSGKYEIFEHARYCQGNNPHHQQLIRTIPWKVIPNLPENDQEKDIYHSHPANEFGRWKWDWVCLETQPDICVSWDDFWMSNFIDQSCFRRFYKTVMMPTVDAINQNEEWLDLYSRTDHILTYTKFGHDVLKNEGGGLIPLRGVATPAVDTNVYKFSGNRREHKKRFGLDPDSIIIGMVARNQRRKLFPDMGEAFAEFVRKLKFENTKNIYLYWHTSHPDVGWNIPKYIKDAGLSHKVLMTYFCHNCQKWFPSFYQDACTKCVHCRQKSAVLSNSQVGVDDQALACVYNFMDLYVQFITNEGLGIPCLEAAACGSPIAATNYSGTEDLINNLNGKAINPRVIFHEAETSRQLSLPSINELVEYIDEFTRLPESVRHNMSVKTANLAVKHYGGWSGVADKWMQIFDSVDISPENLWAASPQIVNTQALQTPPPDKVSDEQFVSWCLGNVLQRPDWVNSYAGLRMMRDLAWGRTVINNLGFFFGEMSQLAQKPTYDRCDRETIMKMVVDMRNNYNASEQMRASYVQQGKIKNV